MAKKYYAVQSGRKTGIFTDWDECKAQIDGYSRPNYKSFSSEADAKAWLNDESAEVQKKPTPVPAEDHPMTRYAYVDGSYNPETGVSGCGGFVVDNNGIRHIIQGITMDPDMTEMRNVGGEILGALAACALAIHLGMKNLIIYYDYQGIESWATGAWKANKFATQSYRDKIKRYKDIYGLNIRFVKVKGHTGVDGNEEADQLAKQAVGVM